jgi:hypothetical protein
VKALIFSVLDLLENSPLPLFSQEGQEKILISEKEDRDKYAPAAVLSQVQTACYLMTREDSSAG